MIYYIILSDIFQLISSENDLTQNMHKECTRKRKGAWNKIGSHDNLVFSS